MINYKKTIILTGAGFSKNFGGYLARELWAKIFNNPRMQEISIIREKLRSNFDFESVYADVIGDSKLSSYEKEIFQGIIIESYVSMDNMLGQYCFNGGDPHQINFYGVSEFLGLFAGSGDEVGVNFTLNQDLFLEKKLNRHALGLGLSRYQHYREAVSSGRLDSTTRVDLPDDEFLNNFKTNHLNSVGDLFYIKLHGSLGWYSVSGSKKMVLGNNKLASIYRAC